MPGGNPGCGDLVTMYVKTEPGSDRIEAVRFEGEGCTISQAAASILADKVNRTHPTLDEVGELLLRRDDRPARPGGRRIPGALRHPRPRHAQDGRQAASSRTGGSARPAAPTSRSGRCSARCSTRGATAGLVYGRAAEAQKGKGGAEARDLRYPLSAIRYRSSVAVIGRPVRSAGLVLSRGYGIPVERPTTDDRRPIADSR